MFLRAAAMVQRFFHHRAVVRLVVHTPALRRGISEGDHPKLITLLRREIDSVAEALVVDRDRQMIDHGQRASRLWHPEQPLIRTINRVVPVAKETQYTFEQQTQDQKPHDCPQESVLLRTRTCRTSRTRTHRAKTPLVVCTAPRFRIQSGVGKGVSFSPAGSSVPLTPSPGSLEHAL